MEKHNRSEPRKIHRILCYMLLIVTLLLISYPRFNRQDVGFIKNYTGKIHGQPSIGDAAFYVNYVHFFRGNKNIHLPDIGVPALYRPLVPFLASQLTFLSPMTALNVINLVCLLLTVFLLLKWLNVLGFSFAHSLIGGFLFVVSFPTFYYGTIGYIDPCVFPIFTAGLIMIYTERWKSLALLLFVGTLVKETSLLLIPVGFSYLIVNHKSWRINLIIWLLAYIIPIIFIRITFLNVGHGIWLPNEASLLENLRIRAALSWILTFGVPGLGLLAFFYRYAELKKFVHKSIFLPIMVGGFFVILLVVYSFIAAYTDGRFLWPMIIFNIPFALLTLQLRYKDLTISENSSALFSQLLS